MNKDDATQNTVYEVEVRYHHGLTNWCLWTSIKGLDNATIEFNRLMEKSKHPLCIFDDVRIIEVISKRRPINIT